MRLVPVGWAGVGSTAALTAPGIGEWPSDRSVLRAPSECPCRSELQSVQILGTYLRAVKSAASIHSGLSCRIEHRTTCQSGDRGTMSADLIRLQKETATRLNAGDLERILRNRPGLLLGPEYTIGRRALAALGDHLAQTFNVAAGDTYCATVDSALDSGNSDEAVRKEIRGYIDRCAPKAQIDRLARIRWTAVISACLDGLFDQAFQGVTERHPMAQPVTILSDPALALPPRHVPVVKLIGSTYREDFVASTVHYATRRSAWQRAVRIVIDRLRGAPLICLGMAECAWVLSDLLGVMVADSSTTPSALIFVDSDPLAEDPNVRRFLTGRSRLVLAPSFSVLLGAASAAEDIDLPPLNRSRSRVRILDRRGAGDAEKTLHG